MSIYLYTDKKDKYIHMFFKAMYDNFIYIDYEALLISKDTENKIDTENKCLFITDYNIKNSHKFFNNDNFIYVIKNLPKDIIIGKHIIEIIDYDSTKIQSYHKRNDAFYFKKITDNHYKIMCIWGSFLLPKQLVKINKEVIENFKEPKKSLYFPYRQHKDINLFFSKFKKEYNWKIICNLKKTIKDCRYGYMVLSKPNNIFDNDFINFFSYGSYCISTDKTIFDIFGDKVLYVENLDNFKENLDNFNFNNKKIIDSLQIIYKKYMLYQRCKDLIGISSKIM